MSVATARDRSDPRDHVTRLRSGRPTNLLPNRELIRISLYWLGLSSIFAGLSFIMAGRLEFTGLADKDGAGRALFLVSISGAFIAVIVQPTIGSIIRLHHLPLGTPQAVHLHRVHPRPRLPRRNRLQQYADRDRRVHRALAVQLELRPGTVPGLRAGPRAGASGRDRQRARRADAGPWRRVGVRHRGDRCRRPPVRRWPRDRSVYSRSRRCCPWSSASARVRRPSRAAGVRGVRSPRRRGAATSSARRASCGWWVLGWRSSWAGSVLTQLALFYLARTLGLSERDTGIVLHPVGRPGRPRDVRLGRSGGADLRPGRAEAGHLGQLRGQCRRPGDGGRRSGLPIAFVGAPPVRRSRPACSSRSTGRS